MKVVILCGGQGTRLREHTEHLPKPLVEIGGRPIVWHIMKHYAHYGHRDFVLCLGYKGWKIKEYFLNYARMSDDLSVDLSGATPPRAIGHATPEDWRITLVETGETAMTGARIARAARYLDGERFLVTYGDGVADIDLHALIATHQRSGGLATVTGVRPPARFGELLLDEGRVARFSEKPQVQDSWINGGFFVFEPQVLNRLSTEDGCVLERAPLEGLAADRQLAAYLHDGFWQCMDTGRDYALLNELWSSGRAPWASWIPRPQAPRRHADGAPGATPCTSPPSCSAGPVAAS